MALCLKIDEVTDCEGKKGRKYTLVCEAAKINKSIMQHSGQLQIRVYLSKWHKLRANVSHYREPSTRHLHFEVEVQLLEICD